MTIQDMVRQMQGGRTISDEEIMSVSYALRYGEYWPDDMASCKPGWEDVLDELRCRLIALENATPAATATADKRVMCSCGHEVEENLVMSASLGTSCCDCYDRMSD
jgi:hypothetical protein